MSESVPSVSYERRDVNFIILLSIAIATGICAIIMHLVLVQIFNLYGTTENRVDSLPIQTAATKMPPGPLLRANPAVDLRTLREAENARLSSYGWIDRKSGVARIPIDRAMELMLKQSGEQSK